MLQTILVKCDDWNDGWLMFKTIKDYIKDKNYIMTRFDVANLIVGTKNVHVQFYSGKVENLGSKKFTKAFGYSMKDQRAVLAEGYSPMKNSMVVDWEKNVKKIIDDYDKYDVHAVKEVM